MSKIFKPYELREIEKRKNKDFSDSSGIFSNRVKPKINELLEIWFPKKKELEKLIENKRNSKDV